MPLLINVPAMIAEVVLLLDDYHVIARERYLRGCNEHRRGYGLGQHDHDAHAHHVAQAGSTERAKAIARACDPSLV